MPAPRTELATAGRAARTARLVEAGELVSNRPFRERVEFLQAHDPEFSLVTVCVRLADVGYPKFLKNPSGTTRTSRMTGDTSHLQRLLGMRDGPSCFKNGRRYTPPTSTQWVSYEFAVALCRALDMDYVDVGV